MLLAGDAVHIHTPAGGQGMNTRDHRRPQPGLEAGPGRLRPRPRAVAGHLWARTAAGRSAGAGPDARPGPVREPDQPGAAGAAGRHRPGSVPGGPDPPGARCAAGLRSTSATRPAAAPFPAGSPAGPGSGSDSPTWRYEHRTGAETGSLPSCVADVHVIVVTGADPASPTASPALQPYRDLFEVVTRGPGDARASRAWSVVLVRPDGYVAAYSRPDQLETVVSFCGGCPAEPRPADPAGGRSGQPGPAHVTIQ